MKLNGEATNVSRSKSNLHNMGWVDPIGKLLALKTAVRILMDCKENYRVRMDRATFPLAGHRAEEFPERIRKTAERVLGVRSAVRKAPQNYGPLPKAQRRPSGV